ncbi:MAG: hypothetical protein ACKVQQ_00640 [Burkholderiales bacterium]
MTDHEATGDRFMRFHALYTEIVKEEFDALEFAEDDFYAFQVLDRAFRCDNQELRNLAAHLQTQREAALETITLRASEIFEQTKRLRTLELKVLEQRGESGDLAALEGDGGAAVVAPAKSEVTVEFPGTGPQTVPDLAPKPPETAAAAAAARERRRRKGWF